MDFDFDAQPLTAVRQVRAVAAATGLKLEPLNNVNAAAAVVGESLWCVVTKRSSLSTNSNWVGVDLQLANWGVTVLQRAAGLRPEVLPDFSNDDVLGTCPNAELAHSLWKTCATLQYWLTSSPLVDIPLSLTDVWWAVRDDAISCIHPTALWVSDICTYIAKESATKATVKTNEF